MEKMKKVGKHGEKHRKTIGKAIETGD